MALYQVYGAHLARGGQTVSVFVKPSQAKTIAKGLSVHALRRFGAPIPEHSYRTPSIPT